MKKCILICALLICCTSIFAQKTYYFKEPKKDVTFQVSAGALDYDGLKYGWSVGANIKERISITYFHTRDYVSAEGSWLDSRFGGLHGSLVFPAGDCFQIGGGIRIATLNNGYDTEFQKPVYSAQMNVDLNSNLKLSFEYGGSKKTSLTAIRLIFNIY